jgi:hypothetical protein|tara:strand:+ start:558 stop:797 length:240 start_codon:yes stop_codon:yes gene_type:complete
MCFGGSKKQDPPPPAPPPAAPPAPNPVMTNMYDPSTPESGDAAEKGAVADKAAGTSQLRVDLDPTLSNIDKNTGLQINK